jgi:hypothetical protein
MVKLKLKLRAEFHRRLAGARWTASLAHFLEETIAGHPEIQSSNAAGVIKSRYDDPRYFGPNSVVKYQFEVALRIQLRGDFFRRATFEASVQYDPNDESFRILRHSTSVDTPAIRRENKRIADAAAKMCKRIRANCSEEEASEFRCPRCEGPIEIGFHPLGESFVLSCAKTECLYHSHEEITSPPTWWDRHISSNWISENSEKSPSH